MASYTGDCPCAACGAMNRVTITKKRVGEKPPEAEYEITAEATLLGGGLFAGSVPDADAEETEEEGE